MISYAKIVVTSSSFSKNEILKRELLASFPNSVLNETGVKLGGEALEAYIKDADGVIVGLEKINKDILKECHNLRAISKYGVGLDNLDLDYCKKKNIYVGWTPGVNKLSVAETALAFMLMLGKNLFLTSSQLKNGAWNKNGGFNLSGKTVGIIGVGNIGKELVRMLKPFYCDIMVNDIIDQHQYYEENGLREFEKECIYRDADFVTIHTPLTALTKNLINSEVLSSMKRTAFLINTSRGGIVKSDDLKWALKNNIIAGAALDVYEEEPPTDNELLGLPNLICTPHIGGNTIESIFAMGRNSIQHLVKYFQK
jgi:phosphoglycerate dehydrogenase-like enzyme